MNGCIAQIIALVLHTKEYLRTKNIPKFLEENSTCQFCSKITFVERRKTFFSNEFKEKEICDNPSAWFLYIASLNPKSVNIYGLNNDSFLKFARESSAFANAGITWCIEVKKQNNQTEVWIPRWSANHGGDNQKIWQVKYYLIEKNGVSKNGFTKIEDAKKNLRKSLEEIINFAQQSKSDCDSFIKCFTNALVSLDSQLDKLHGYPDLYPSGFLSVESANLLHACQNAWVFGGMGSWNDMSFKGTDAKKYETVSDNLFSAINMTIEAVVNS